MNAMGTAIIRDGAPISNNANLSAMSPTVLSGTETPASLAEVPRRLVEPMFVVFLLKI